MLIIVQLQSLKVTHLKIFFVFQDSLEGHNGQAEMAPVFFNPNQFSAAVPATRRNKYAWNGFETNSV